MNTMKVSSNDHAAGIGLSRWTLDQALLACGILSSLLYMAINILGALQWEGYSLISQTFSELIAVDAPSSALAVPLCVLYGLLIYAFGWGVWRSAGARRSLRVAALLIIGKEVFGLVGTLFAPLHLRGVEGNLSDVMHGILTMVGVLGCMFPAMGFGAAAFGTRFRIYTAATMVIFLVCGTLAGMDQPLYVANLPTPWMGLYERINISGYLLWIAVLAAALLNARPVTPGAGRQPALLQG
jgi:hypothetical protein